MILMNKKRDKDHLKKECRDLKELKNLLFLFMCIGRLNLITKSK